MFAMILNFVKTLQFRRAHDGDGYWVAWWVSLFANTWSLKTQYAKSTLPNFCHFAEFLEKLRYTSMSYADVNNAEMT